MTLNTTLPDPYRRLYQHAAAVVPDNVVDLVPPAEALWIGSIAGGDTIRIITAGNEQVDVLVTAGQLLSFRVTRVLNNGTLASLIVALW